MRVFKTCADKRPRKHIRVWIWIPCCKTQNPVCWRFLELQLCFITKRNTILYRY
jgi:hypothetical protein